MLTKTYLGAQACLAHQADPLGLVVLGSLVVPAEFRH